MELQFTSRIVNNIKPLVGYSNNPSKPQQKNQLFKTKNFVLKPPERQNNF